MLVKEQLPPWVDIVMLPYHTAFDDAGRPLLTFYRERLLRRARRYRWEGEVHEVIPVAGRRISLPLPVEHRKLHASEPGRNLRILEGLIRSGRELSPRQQFYYARELLFAGRYRQAAIWLERFLHAGGWREDNIRACLDLSLCMEQLGREEEALRAVFRSFLYDNPRAESCCAAGGLLERRGDYERAVYCIALRSNAPKRRAASATRICRSSFPACSSAFASTVSVTGKRRKSTTAGPKRSSRRIAPCSTTSAISRPCMRLAKRRHRRYNRKRKRPAAGRRGRREAP